jgi:cysteine sulfinate desulfinase/cysteine desulfurase-like protein
MIYLNSNKFTINNSDSFKACANEISNKQAVISLLKDKLDISDYSVYFVNNIYEAYVLLLQAVIVSYSSIKKKPHIVTNKMEDPQLLLALENFKKNGSVSVSYVKPNIYGTINADEIELAIQKNKTCLIINSFINYFTGSINNVQKIGEMAHKYKVPLFCDCTYSFGKLPIKPAKQNIDIMTFDLNHPGLSFIIVNNNLLKGYKLAQHSVRFKPDVENVYTEDPHIYGLAKSIITTLYKNRKSKNKRLTSLKSHLLKNIDFMYYSDFVTANLSTITEKTEKTSHPSAHVPDAIVFGNDIKNENVCAPHIISILRVKKRKKISNVQLCQVPGDVFLNIGVNGKWNNKIITIGLSDMTTFKDLNSIIKST